MNDTMDSAIDTIKTLEAFIDIYEAALYDICSPDHPDAAASDLRLLAQHAIQDAIDIGE